MITEGDATVRLYCYRMADCEPYWGGAGIRSVYAYCSTAFAARYPNGKEVMISAWHCADPYEGTQWRIADPQFGDRIYGFTNGHRDNLDAMLITDRDYAPRVYTGAWDSTTSTYVRSAGNPTVGTFVCASGAFSGQDCALKVTRTGVYISGVGPLFETEQNAHIASVGEGDSGGPVFTPHSAGGVVANGVIILGDGGTQGACRGLQWSGRRCFWRTYHVQVPNILSAFGVTIQTG